MAKGKYKAPRGTFDVLPGTARIREKVEGVFAELVEQAGFEPIATPLFEETELFERGVGHSTDIVRKEMFTFEDKGGRSLTLRPEGTAPICRAYLEHGMHKLPQPVKLAYCGPFFRHERPQAGRHRQFHQLGIESIGTDMPLADAEAISLLSSFLGRLGVPRVKLRLGSLGSPQARRSYLEELRAYLHANEAELPRDVRERIDVNPLRAFDSDDEGTRALMVGAPKLLDRLEGEDADHFAEVRKLLDRIPLYYEIDPTLVRGLDYYTRTIFSLDCELLGAQSEIGGGGRYDGLVEQLGGPPTPAVGWAAGMDRIVLALREEDKERVAPELYVAVGPDSLPAQRQMALGITTHMRREGAIVELDLSGRSLKGQYKHAKRLGAQKALVFGEGNIFIRLIETGEEQPVAELMMAVEEMGGPEAFGRRVEEEEAEEAEAAAEELDEDEDEDEE